MVPGTSGHKYGLVIKYDQSSYLWLCSCMAEHLKNVAKIGKMDACV